MHKACTLPRKFPRTDVNTPHVHTRTGPADRVTGAPNARRLARKHTRPTVTGVRSGAEESLKGVGPATVLVYWVLLSSAIVAVLELLRLSLRAPLLGPLAHRLRFCLEDLWHASRESEGLRRGDERLEALRGRRRGLGRRARAALWRARPAADAVERGQVGRAA